MGYISISDLVSRVVAACAHDPLALDYLWKVMEGMGDGVRVDEVVDDLFERDLSRLGEARALTESAWADGGGAELAPELVQRTVDDRLVMFAPARDVIYGLLDTD